MNDSEREQWVNNDESLYHWWLGTRRMFGNGEYKRVSIREFVRTNRADIDSIVASALNQARYDRYIGA